MDGTSIGGRKDLLPPVEATAVPEQKVKGSTIEQRLFIREERPRILLAKYANLSKKSSRYSNDIVALPDLEFDELLQLLSSNPSLHEVIRQGGNPCPKSIQTLVGELSRDSPTCAMLHVTGNTNIEAYNILTQLYLNHLVLLRRNYLACRQILVSCLLTHNLLLNHRESSSLLTLQQASKTLLLEN